VDAADPLDRLPAEGVVELAVREHEERGHDARGVLELGHLERVLGREVHVVPQDDVRRARAKAG
jgi:hypothetical protein